jgi:hypothetical protein
MHAVVPTLYASTDSNTVFRTMLSEEKGCNLIVVTDKLEEYAKGKGVRKIG